MLFSIVKHLRIKIYESRSIGSQTKETLLQEKLWGNKIGVAKSTYRASLEYRKSKKEEKPVRKKSQGMEKKIKKEQPKEGRSLQEGT